MREGGGEGEHNGVWEVKIRKGEERIGEERQRERDREREREKKKRETSVYKVSL